MSGLVRKSIVGFFSFFALTAAAHAGPYWADAHWKCTGKKDQKRISAHLMNVPAGQDWKKYCLAYPTGPYGLKEKPHQCLINNGVWGVWYKPDPNACGSKARWIQEKKECSGPWKSTISARLWDTRPGESWEYRCGETPLSAALTRLGASGAPECKKGTLAEGMWGEWYNNDDDGCGDGRFARYPLEVANKSSKDVWATVMWINDGNFVTNEAVWVKAGKTAKLSIAGIDCNPAELERRLGAGADGNAWNAGLRDLTNGTADSCLNEHFQVFFWDSQEAFLGYAAENAAIEIATYILVDQLIGKVTGGVIPLPGAQEAAGFAGDKWRQIRDPDGRLKTWGVHGWAYNVPQQQATVYYWGRDFAQDVVLDSANVGTLQPPSQRSPRFVYELPVGDSTPEIMQKRFCDQDC